MRVTRREGTSLTDERLETVYHRPNGEPERELQERHNCSVGGWCGGQGREKGLWSKKKSTVVEVLWTGLVKKRGSC